MPLPCASPVPCASWTATSPAEAAPTTRWNRPRTARTPTTVQDRAFAEISANVGQTLCKIAIHLLDKQVDSQARKFEQEGGFSERLYKVRSEAKARKQQD